VAYCLLVRLPVVCVLLAQMMITSSSSSASPASSTSTILLFSLNVLFFWLLSSSWSYFFCPLASRETASSQRSLKRLEYMGLRSVFLLLSLFLRVFCSLRQRSFDGRTTYTQAKRCSAAEFTHVHTRAHNERDETRRRLLKSFFSRPERVPSSSGRRCRSRRRRRRRPRSSEGRRSCKSSLWVRACYPRSGEGECG